MHLENSAKMLNTSKFKVETRQQKKAMSFLKLVLTPEIKFLQRAGFV